MTARAARVRAKQGIAAGHRRRSRPHLTILYARSSGYGDKPARPPPRCLRGGPRPPAPAEGPIYPTGHRATGLAFVIVLLLESAVQSSAAKLKYVCGPPRARRLPVPASSSARLPVDDVPPRAPCSCHARSTRLLLWAAPVHSRDCCTGLLSAPSRFRASARAPPA